MVELTNDENKPVPSKWRICAYFADEKVNKILERQAAKENRSLSNFVATILIKAAEEIERAEQGDNR